MEGLRPLVTAYVGLGANLGDAEIAVRGALRSLSSIQDTCVTGASRLYRSAPVDAAGPDFINAVAALQTRLSAPALLAALRALEQAAGRQRPYRNAPRTLDLDLLLYGEGRIDSPGLTVPHPRLAGRAFVLRPLAELAPTRVAAGMLDAVRDQACTPLDGRNDSASRQGAHA
jgi:2-amino-4-hydroxy-6-hydroxymethyldihydropteridine diphosphokinase